MTAGWLLCANLEAGTIEIDGDLHADDLTASGELTSPPGIDARARWNPDRCLLELARDRTGLHPLFYAEVGGTIVAATDLRALVTRVEARPSRDALAAWLHGRPAEPSETLFDQVRRVPAGHVLTAGPTGARLRQDWTPSRPGSRPRSSAQRFGEVLEEAVSRSAQGGQAAVYLSGGLDSAAVTAAAAAVGTPLALCVDFEGASELSTQRTVSDALGIRRIETLVAAGDSLVRDALDLVRESLWPTPAVWAPAFEELATRAHAAGATVLLDGLGGDELLDGGYAAGRALLHRPWWLPAWLRAERRYAGGALASARAALGDTKRAGFADERLRDFTDAALSMQREATFDLGLRTGLPRRHPLWDSDVVDLLDGLPPEALVAGGHPKSPARAYLVRRVPPIRGPWPRPQVADALATSLSAALHGAVADRGLERLAKLGLGLPPGDLSTGLPFHRIWPMLSLDSWLAGVEDWGERA